MVKENTPKIMEKEEENRDEDIVDQDLDLMVQGPLSLLDNLHKMRRNSEKLLSKSNRDKKIKEKDHIDNFYMHLRMLKPRYNYVSCKLFSYKLEGRAVTWYHSFAINSLHSWRKFTKLFVEKFIDKNIPAMLLKELGNSKMGGKEKVKYFNQRLKCL